MEVAAIQKTPIDGITVTPRESDALRWDCIISGPPGSPYEGGKFKVLLTFQSDYPKTGPYVTFQTKIWHPNIYADGRCCLKILQTWGPAVKADRVLKDTVALMASPNPNCVAEAEIGQMFATDKAAFDQKARQWTAEYAK